MKSTPTSIIPFYLYFINVYLFIFFWVFSTFLRGWPSQAFIRNIDSQGSSNTFCFIFFPLYRDKLFGGGGGEKQAELCNYSKLVLTPNLIKINYCTITLQSVSLHMTCVHSHFQRHTIRCLYVIVMWHRFRIWLAIKLNCILFSYLSTFGLKFPIFLRQINSSIIAQPR